MKKQVIYVTRIVKGSPEKTLAVDDDLCRRLSDNIPYSTPGKIMAAFYNGITIQVAPFSHIEYRPVSG